MDKYTKQELENMINDSTIVEPERLKPYLVETFSILPKNIVDCCFSNMVFLEMDRWGEFYPCDRKSLLNQQQVVRISWEALTLKPGIAKFVFLHEIGHAEKNDFPPMSNRKLRKEQDKRADEFAAKYFAEWHRYFYRDNNGNLELTDLGKKSKNAKNKSTN